MSNTFLTSIFYQKAGDMTKWSSRGINTAFGMDNEGGTKTYAAWKAACTAAGIKYIVQWIEPFTPAGAHNPYLTSADNDDPNLIGVLLPDEPNGAANISPGQCLNYYDEIKQTLPNKPVFTCLDGNQTQWKPFCDTRCYAAASDWLGYDYYVINRGEGPGRIPFIGNRLDYIIQAGNAAGGAKKYFVAIECSDQDLRKQGYVQAYPAVRDAMRGPTGTEMLAEVNQCLARPNFGMVLWFPEGIGIGFEGSDVMNADQISSMTVINQMLLSR